jgi:hypothetical protein
MKLKAIVLGLCVGVIGSGQAATVHTHPKANVSANSTTPHKNRMPGYCQIEIINNSYAPVRVHEQFDDGATDSFVIYPYEVPHIIDLFDDYYGYCHQSMHLLIKSTVYPYYTLYSGVTRVGNTVRIVPTLGKGQKVEVQPK